MSASVDLAGSAEDYYNGSPDDVVSVWARTWNRDSHELFDYEAQYTTDQELRVFGNSIDLVRIGNQVRPVVSPAADGSHPGAEFLMSLTHQKGSGQYLVRSKALSTYNWVSKSLWSVIGNNYPDGVRLHEGDVIRLGRFQVKVREICRSDGTHGCSIDDNTSCSSICSHEEKVDSASDSHGDPRPDIHITGGNSRAVTSLELEDAVANPGVMHLQCRICLMDGPIQDDPLIQPCECAGSIRYVHANCLSRWIDGRLGYNGSKTFKPAFFYRPVACELCHASYPTYYKTSHSPPMGLFSLAVLPPVRTPFIVFENLGGTASTPPWNNDNSNTFPSGLHIVSLPDNSSIKIGRGHDCELRISDVSISRVHAQIRFESGHFYLQDEKSKFGTLLAIQDSALIVPHSTSSPPFITLQAGRTVVMLKANSPEVSFSTDDIISMSPLSPQNNS